MTSFTYLINLCKHTLDFTFDFAKKCTGSLQKMVWKNDIDEIVKIV